MSEPKLSKYAQKVAKRNTLAAALQRVEEQKREALPEQAERKKVQPPPPPRSAVANLGEMPSKAGELLRTAAIKPTAGRARRPRSRRWGGGEDGGCRTNPMPEPKDNDENTQENNK